MQKFSLFILTPVFLSFSGCWQKASVIKGQSQQKKELLQKNNTEKNAVLDSHVNDELPLKIGSPCDKSLSSSGVLIKDRKKVITGENSDYILSSVTLLVLRKQPGATFNFKVSFNVHEMDPKTEEFHFVSEGERKSDCLYYEGLQKNFTDFFPYNVSMIPAFSRTEGIFTEKNTTKVSFDLTQKEFFSFIQNKSDALDQNGKKEKRRYGLGDPTLLSNDEEAYTQNVYQLSDTEMEVIIQKEYQDPVRKKSESEFISLRYKNKVGPEF